MVPWFPRPIPKPAAPLRLRCGLRNAASKCRGYRVNIPQGRSSWDRQFALRYPTLSLGIRSNEVSATGRQETTNAAASASPAEIFPRGFMKPILSPLIVLALGAGASIVLRFVVTSRAGFTLTRPGGTYLFGWNLVCFWAVLILTMALSGYLYLRRSTH